MLRAVLEANVGPPAGDVFQNQTRIGTDGEQNMIAAEVLSAAASIAPGGRPGLILIQKDAAFLHCERSSFVAGVVVTVVWYSDQMKKRRALKAAIVASDRPSFGDSSAAPDIEQAGAICYRRNGSGQLRVLLIGSRRNGRWGVQKGHVDEGETSHAAAKRESFEEAGVVGDVDEDVFGSFSYQKDSAPHRYHVAVHLLRVSRLASEFPEKATRKQKWFPLKVAIRDAAQPGLRILLSKLKASDL